MCEQTTAVPRRKELVFVAQAPAWERFRWMTSLPLYRVTQEVDALLDRCGRRRSPATMPGFRLGKKPGNHGKHYSQDVIPNDEMQLLLTTPSRTSATGLRNRALIGVMYRAGLRVGCELLRLQMADLDRASRSLVVEKGKNSKSRIVPMDDYGWELLDPWLEARAELLDGLDDYGWVFCTVARPVTGGPLAASSVRKMLKDACEFSGITRRVTPHTLRHTFASNLLDEGVPLLVISHMLGHSNVATTDIYVNHLPTEKLREVVLNRPRPVNA